MSNDIYSQLAYENEIMTESDMQQALHLSKNKVRNMLNQGIIPAVKFGKDYRITRGEFNKWMKASGRKKFEVID